MIEYKKIKGKETKVKKKHTIKILTSILLILLLIALIVTAYFIFADIESKATKEIRQTCSLEIKEFMSRKIFIIEPKEGASNNKKILYFHGGSYVAEASKEHWNFIEKIVKETGMTVIMPDYPLTPKYNYKDVFRMVIPLYKEIIEKVKPEDLIVIGDSAGGGLALALEEKISEQKVELPNKTILISPWLDVRLQNEKIDEVQKLDKELNKETLILAGIAYAGEDGIDSSLVNPIDGDLSKLKNITIYTGTNDILNPDVHILKEKAENVGVEINVKEYKDAQHIWIINNNSSEEITQKAYTDFIEEIKSEIE